MGICGEELSTCTAAIAAGANVNAFDDGGWTALHHAARNNGLSRVNAALVKLLLSAGADPSAKSDPIAISDFITSDG